MMLTALLHTLWLGFQGFLYYYPLFMSYLWMMGAVLFVWRNERRRDVEAVQRIPRDSLPGVSVLVPCFNEGAHAEETIRYALEMDYPVFEVLAINDGSADDTGAILDAMAAQDPRLRVVHMDKNQGKAMALQSGCLMARHEILLCIDGDALLDAECARWIVPHFSRNEVAAVTGNPRIRNRSTLLGRLQVGEFSSIVGMIKRAQRSFGRLFTVSGVITAFRKSALHDVGYWSADMLTEDIDITWKLQRAGWDVRFEPRALVWILMPETMRGLWKQRLRWATGGAQVLMKNFGVIRHPTQNHLWPLLLELCLSLLWAYALLAMTLVWLAGLLLPHGWVPLVGSPLIPRWGSALLGATCLLQFAVSKWLDSRYDHGLGRNYYWMVWYPLAFWLINITATIVAFPRALLRRGARARWVSPDRGAHLRKPPARLEKPRA